MQILHYVWSEGKHGIERTKTNYIESTSWLTSLLFDDVNFRERTPPVFLNDELLVASQTLEVEGALAPAYANDKAYSLKYDGTVTHVLP